MTAKAGLEAPATKKRAIDMPAAHDLFVGDQSLEMSSDGSPAQEEEETRPKPRGQSGRPPSDRRGSGVQKPGKLRSRAGARSLSATRMPMSRGSSSAQSRPPLPTHEVVQQSRGYGETDIDVRLRVLEAQRDVDHAYLQKLTKSIELLTVDLDKKGIAVKEHSQALQEQTKLNFRIHHEMEAVKNSSMVKAQELMADVPQAVAKAMDERLNVTIQEIIARTTTAMQTLQMQLALLFESVAKTEEQKQEDGKIIEGAFQRAQHDLAEVKDFLSKSQATAMAPGVAPTTVVPGEAVVFTRPMFDDLKKMYEQVKGIEELQNIMKFTSDRANIISKNLDELSGLVGANAHRILQLEQHVNSTEQDVSFRAGLCGSGPCGGGCGPGVSGGRGPGVSGAGAFGSMNGLNAGPAGGQQTGSSGDGNPLGVMAAIIGGNGSCHCIHVKEVIEKVAVLERAGARGGTSREGINPERDYDPLLETGWQPPRSQGSGQAKRSDVPRGPDGRMITPLRLLEPLGSVGYKEKPLFDDKLAEREEYRYNGTKNGVAWKGKVERHFISRAPVLKDVLAWAEEENLEEITTEKFKQVVGGRLTSEQVIIANAAIWGFLSAAISGAAETMFKGASTLNGLDAWRRITRYIDQGKAIRLESLRRDVRNITLKPIPSLDKIEEGIAEFENTLREYADTGGTAFSEYEMKNDLLQILPGELSETLLWKATDEGSFQKFRDHVITMSAKILQNRRKLPIHAVSEGPDQHGGNDENLDLSNVSSFEDLVMAIGKWNNRRGGRPPPGVPQPRTATAITDRAPRKCPNCNGEHQERRCPRPAVAVKDRACWGCGEKGHTRTRCPQRQRDLKAMEDGPASPGNVNGFFMVEDEGFKTPKKTCRPLPRTATLADFMTIELKNGFNALSTDDGGSSPDIKAAIPVAQNGPHQKGTTPPAQLAAQFQFVQSPALARGSASGAATDGAGNELTEPRATIEHNIAEHEQKRAIKVRVKGEKLEKEFQSPKGTKLLENSGQKEKEFKSKKVEEFPALPRCTGTLSSTSTSCSTLSLSPPTSSSTPTARTNIMECVDCLEEILRSEPRTAPRQNSLACVLDQLDDDEDVIGSTIEKVLIRPAMDSGAVDNVIHPKELPDDAEPEPNTTGKHFRGANNSVIEKYGSCDTTLESSHGSVGCGWQLANVTRPLHSVSKVTGPPGAPGKQDVLFNNERCVVVPPGVVEEVLKRTRPIAEYKREGNLYIGEMTMSSCRRQGQKA